MKKPVLSVACRGREGSADEGRYEYVTLDVLAAVTRKITLF
jgi:hypothetical protein